MLTSQSISISKQFVGPPDYGNGGYVVGLLAGALASTLEGGDLVGVGAIEVTLKAPLPLDTTLPLSFGEDDVSLMHHGNVIAVGKRTGLELEVPAMPARSDVLAASPKSLSLKQGFHATLGDRLGVHPVCFCCGAEREEGEGLRVFPAALDGAAQAAALWTPAQDFADVKGMVPAEIIAAAIDCPGAFAWMHQGKMAGLLGRMTAQFFKPLEAGVETTVIGWTLEASGRKMTAGTALYDAAGDLVAKSKQVWFGFG